MQGASILAAGKVYENDIGRGASSLSAGAANSKGFTDCLRKQNQIINSSPSDTSSGSEPAESRLTKLDRSALLRVPVAKNSRVSKEPAKDAASCETMVTDTDKMGTSLVTDCSAVQAQPQTKADAGTTNETAVVEQQVIDAVANNLTAAGSALPLEVVKTPGSQTVQPVMEQNTADSSANTADMVMNMANSNAEPELQSGEGIAQGNLIQPTKEPVLVADSSEKIAAEAPQPEGNQIKFAPESSELSSQSNSVSVTSGKTATATQVAGPTDELKSPDSSTLTAREAQPSPETVPATDGSTKMTVTEAGTELPAQMAPKPEAESVSPRLEDDSVPQQPVADSPELLIQVANKPEPVAGQPVVGQAVSTEVPEAAPASAMSLEDVVAAVAPQSPKPAQAAKGEAKENRSEAKSDTTGAKNALEVFKAMAGKLEEPESNSSVQTEKKENAGSGDLKKLMEFENNRLQAASLKETSPGAGNSSPVDKSAMVTVTLLPQTPSINDLNQNLTAKLSDQAPVDVKSLIDQVVQKAELTVKANSSEMKILLEPEFLGKLTIKIALEDGLLTARFTTENHQVKHLLESNLASLRQSLEAQGIKVEKTEVNVQLDSGGTFGGYDEGRQEMWQRPETPNYRNNSYAAGSYELTGEAEPMDPTFSQTEYYGIQADGSMNFVV